MTSVQLFAFNHDIAKVLKARVTEAAWAEPAMKFPPSPYQAAIFDWMAYGKGSLIVNAVAGSGKTTSIIASLRHIPGLRPRDIRAGTFHSVGFNAVCKKLGKRAEEMFVDGGKLKKLAKLTLSEVDQDLYGDFVVKLVGLAKGQGIGPLCPDVEEAWYGLIQHHDLYLDDYDATEAQAIAFARQMLRDSNRAAELGTIAKDPQGDARPWIDFDDMLYLPLLWRLRIWQNDFVLVDEAQDTNPVRRAIAKLALRPGGRLIAVGDRRQAIYGFTGASTDAMDLIQREFNCAELPLTVSYRCPKSVARRVRTIVPYFEVPDGAAEGQVLSMSVDEALKVLTPADAIVCRQTAPLVSLAFSLIAKGTACAVLGKEIGTGLVSLVRRQKAGGIDRLLDKLDLYQAREVAKYTAKGEEGKAEAVMDRVACVKTIVENLPEDERTVPGLIRRLEGLFSDDGGRLSLATGHKVKGREFPRVAVLAPELMPSRWARQDWQYQQELNLQYVVWTRPMELLIELTDGGPKPRKKADQSEREAA